MAAPHGQRWHWQQQQAMLLLGWAPGFLMDMANCLFEELGVSETRQQECSNSNDMFPASGAFASQDSRHAVDWLRRTTRECFLGTRA